MYEFKVGDIVECIRVDGNSYIKLGQTYKCCVLLATV